MIIFKFLFIFVVNKNKMNENQIKILSNLLDREIENFNSVYKRTNREDWLERINELKQIKTRLEKINSEEELIANMDEDIKKYFR